MVLLFIDVFSAWSLPSLNKAAACIAQISKLKAVVVCLRHTVALMSLLVKGLWFHAARALCVVLFQELIQQSCGKNVLI